MDREMVLHAFTHVAVRVNRLREAEDFYRRLFLLEVGFREAETPDGWRTLPESAGWDDAVRSGVELGLVMLYRDGIRLALEAAESIAADGQLSHIGLQLDDTELDRVRAEAVAANCAIAVDRPNALVFKDPFGINWELNTFPYTDPPTMSTGAGTGRWVDVAPKQPPEEMT